MKFMSFKQQRLLPLVPVGFLAFCLLWLAARSLSAEEGANEADLIGPPIVAAAQGVVEVTGGLLRITPPRDGIVTSLRVGEGDQVQAGDILATLDSRQEALTAQIATEEVLQAEERYSLLQMKMKSLSRQADRVKRAAAGNAVSDQARDDAVLAADSLAGELKIAASVLAASKMRRDIAVHEVEIRTVRAPVGGFIIRQSIKVGEFAAASTAADMFTLLPDGQKVVRAELQEQFIDKVKPGISVDVLAESRPWQAYHGRISRISPVLMQSAGVPGERSDIRTATMIVTVGQNAPFRVGQRVIIRVYN
jgi:multidrug resistance efflux pump